MAIAKQLSDIIFELKTKNFFKNISSVIDMGDQDVNLTFEEILNYFKKTGLSFKKEYFDPSKNYPERPRVSSSMLWKSLGIKTTDKIDIIELERDLSQKNGNIFIQDLNYPLKDKSLEEKYDLVTDFGNNEHPFNFIEAYKTMHKLCKEKGYIMIYQGVFNGNGFINFDPSFFENFAAINNYSIINSRFLFNFPKKIYFSTPIGKEYLKTVDLNKLENIELFYLLKKEKNAEFKYPYQDKGSSWNSNEYYTVDFSSENNLPKKFYIPQKNEQSSIKLILKKILKSFKIIK